MYMTSRLGRRFLLPVSQAQKRTMSSGNGKPVFFGPFEVTDQVFYATPLSFAIVNLKPLLPGHVLISPHRVVPRFTDLTPAETSDLLLSVQRVQRMLALTYFQYPSTVLEGSFNIAIQDGEEAGQSVPHVHCHIIPRMRGDTKGDRVYDELAGEKGNVGGKLWDREVGERPKPGGKFPKIEDEDRMARSEEEMREEAVFFAEKMRELEVREKGENSL